MWGDDQPPLIAEVHVEKEFYQDLLDQISDGVYFVTRDRHITYWNGGGRCWATTARRGYCVTSMTRAANSVCMVARLRR